MLFTFKDLKYVFLSHSFAFSQLQLQNVNVKVNGTKDETMDAAMIDVARFIKSYSTFSHFLIPSEKGVDGYFSIFEWGTVVVYKKKRVG